jgi:Glycosyl hydrolases family 16
MHMISLATLRASRYLQRGRPFGAVHRFLLGGAIFAASALSSTVPAQESHPGFAPAQLTILPRIDTHFTQPWPNRTSPDGVWRIAGPWKGSGDNLLDPLNVKFSRTYKGENGAYLLLTSKAHELRGAEVQTLPALGFGYYETRLRVTDVPGVCVSFFWIQAPSYGPLEIDIEFLTNEPWISSANSGQVHFAVHPDNSSHVVDLPFNPKNGFHLYGFLWTPGQVEFTVDKRVVYTYKADFLDSPVKGFTMMNSWTGKPDWGGGPPAEDATSAYEWVRFYSGVNFVP